MPVFLAMPSLLFGQTRIVSQECPDPVIAFPVRIGKNWGILNTEDLKVWNTRYQVAYQFSRDGIARAIFEGTTGFVNVKGEIIFSLADHAEAEDFSEELAAVKIGAKWGFVNRLGKMVFAPQFDAVQSFHEGLAAVKVAGQWRFINKAGDVFMEPNPGTWGVSFVGSFHDGLAQIHARDGKVGFIDKSGVWVIPPSFEEARDFSDGLAAVKTDGKWGYIDTKGNVQLRVQYMEAGPFKDGLAPVSIQESAAVPPRVGFVNRYGEFVIAPHFDAANPFCGGMSAVNYDGNWGYIKKDGTFVIGPRLPQAFSFAGDYALVVSNDNRGTHRIAVIDKRGVQVWTAPSTIILIDKYPT